MTNHATTRRVVLTQAHAALRTVVHGVAAAGSMFPVSTRLRQQGSLE